MTKKKNKSFSICFDETKPHRIQDVADILSLLPSQYEVTFNDTDNPNLVLYNIGNYHPKKTKEKQNIIYFNMGQTVNNYVNDNVYIVDNIYDLLDVIKFLF